jgi:hypothetical protein
MPFYIQHANCACPRLNGLAVHGSIFPRRTYCYSYVRACDTGRVEDPVMGADAAPADSTRGCPRPSHTDPRPGAEGIPARSCRCHGRLPESPVPRARGRRVSRLVESVYSCRPSRVTDGTLEWSVAPRVLTDARAAPAWRRIIFLMMGAARPHTSHPVASSRCRVARARAAGSGAMDSGSCPVPFRCRIRPWQPESDHGPCQRRFVRLPRTAPAKCYAISGPVNQALQDCWAKAQIIVESSSVQFQKEVQTLFQTKKKNLKWKLFLIEILIWQQKPVVTGMTAYRENRSEFN